MTTGPYLLDAMLGKLAVYLRMCGFDTAYALDRGVEADDDLLELAIAEERTLVTRDAPLAERADRTILIRSPAVTDQLQELQSAGVTLGLADPPTRAGSCNGRLEAVRAGAETPVGVPEADETRLWRCSACGQYFWRGSHWGDVRGTLAEL